MQKSVRLVFGEEDYALLVAAAKYIPVTIFARSIIMEYLEKEIRNGKTQER